ncbi:hypothetical protein ASF44_12415 [Pseudorhodoferax sp. Leaf274]|nr:hypothetical protein ASF44_12415 [Pseudorhodoferax sp. Leaf274]
MCAAAQPADPQLDQARALMAANQPQAAYALLEPAEPARAVDPRYSYLLGIAALDAGHVTRAIFALERVVAIDPDHNLARAELARAYLAAGEPANARSELRTARRGQMPPEAAAAIDRVLGAIDMEPMEATTGIWRGYLEGVVGHDSNVNSATAAGQFALPAFGGIVFNLDRENRQRGDAFAGLGAGVGLRLPLTPSWELEASVNARNNAHRHADAQDNRSLDGSVGAAYTTGPSRFSAAVQATQYDIDQQRYRRAAGLTAQWQYTLDKQSQLSVFTQYSRLDYAQDSARNADRTVFGAGYARAFNDGQQVAYGSVYRAEEKTRSSGVDNYGHRALGVRLGAEATAGPRTVAFAALQYERRRYGGTEPFFDASREDRQFDATAGVHFTPAPQWRISPQLSFARAESNVVLYDYRRVIWQVAVRREFN